jgi:molybdopterin synthase sulfur carrier subunit
MENLRLIVVPRPSPKTLTARFPELFRHVRDEQGQIRQFLNIYLNEEDIRFLGGESCSLKEGDRVLLVPSIAGGCTK